MTPTGQDKLPTRLPGRKATGMPQEEWRVSRPEKGVICFKFLGRLSGGSGAQSAKVLADALSKEDLRIIFDVRDMTGYETEARNAWQSTLFPKRKHIKSIVMRGGNTFVRLGGTVLAMALGCIIEFE